ncbi:hypothetical protein QZH41_013958 [Actinostola sp. cb2023]|nr:hypothetical protein QZH41_013958 [Actinostola sp. cb2023]
MTSPVERKIETLTDTQRRRKVTWEELYTHLYGHHDIETVDPEEIRIKRTRRTSRASEEETADKIQRRRSSSPLAALVFPDEVQLCRSSIPGAEFGVCAARPVPPGTWIGPYEGQIVSREEITPEVDTKYMWEIYKEGRFSHYVNGEDERTSSWMRYIQCARYKEEQNMTVFQYCGNIYYRAYRHIPAGREMLVWYDEKIL